MRIVLATICCRFGSWGLVKKLNFDQVEGWSSGKICSWSLASFFSWFFRGYEIETCLKIHPFCYRQPSLADVDAEKCVDNSLVQIWKLKFGPKIIFFSRLWAQGLVKILKLKVRQDFEAGVWLVFYRWCFVQVRKLNLGRDSETMFGQYFEF